MSRPAAPRGLSLVPGDDAKQAAERIGVSKEAIDLVRASDVIDLHIDSFIPIRVFGWDLRHKHGRWPFFGRCFGHIDVPRLAEAGLTGGMWSITTNPFRTKQGRWKTFVSNLNELVQLIEASGGRLRVARTYAEYRIARSAGAHACILSIQGGNALEGAPEGPKSIPGDLISRVTLVHLTSSAYGATSAPFKIVQKNRNLTATGKDFVRRLNDARIFVDLAHAHPDTFWDAVEVHDRTQPFLVTHTGISGVKPSWRNLDDRQIKAVADTGGTIGIIFSQHFLKTPTAGSGAEMILAHVQHVIDVAGEDFASIGSDYDGFIVPPPDLRSVAHLPRLVEAMLRRGWSSVRIGKVLGGNFLRCLKELRPG